MSDKDWYELGQDNLLDDISGQTGVDILQVHEVYNWLCNEGFIDYDTEKELIWGRENPDEEKD